MKLIRLRKARGHEHRAVREPAAESRRARLQPRSDPLGECGRDGRDAIEYQIAAFLLRSLRGQRREDDEKKGRI